ncbi:MAG: class I SAM-dependent rRNA methyltransferase [Proteobacteria bacterium]|nr:MAG: class I SAM-dependent rRNA methyltransferase [Pseudomonadota bacterium]
MTDTAQLPIIRLRPNAAARAIRFGFPWVYDNELVMDRRSRKIEAGTLGILQDADRNDLGLVAINPNSKIVARVLDNDISTTINADWFRDRFQRALDMRARLFDRPFYRLIHAESDGLPGVIIDRFDDHFVVQPNAAWADRLMDALVEALVDVTGARVVIKNASGRTRGLEGLDDVSLVLRGDMPSAPIQVPMNGAVYMADLAGGQKTGLFFDQRPNHAFAAGLSKGARVLDVFSHVGGFSLAALAAGADHAVAVDGSAAALDLAKQGAAAMGVQDAFETRRGDAFDVMTQLVEEGAQFDVVICDPPAFASSKPALEAGLRAYERVARLAAQLVIDGGYLGLCSCSHAADLAKFRAASIRGIGRAGRKSALIHTGFAGPDHPLHPQLAESGYLKSLFFRL